MFLPPLAFWLVYPKSTETSCLTNLVQPIKLSCRIVTLGACLHFLMASHILQSSITTSLKTTVHILTLDISIPGNLLTPSHRCSPHLSLLLPPFIHTLPILTPPTITPLSLAPTLYLGVTLAQSLALSVIVLAIMPTTALPLPLCHTHPATPPHFHPPHPPKIDPFQSPEPMPDKSGRLNLTSRYLLQLFPLVIPCPPLSTVLMKT